MISVRKPVGLTSRKEKTRIHTPLDRPEDGSFELFWETGVESERLGTFAVEGLEEVETALASDLALEDLELIEGHASGIGLVVYKDFAGLGQVEDGTVAERRGGAGGGGEGSRGGGLENSRGAMIEETDV